MSGTEKDIWCDDGRPMCRHGGRSHTLNVACPDDEPRRENFSLRQLADPQVLTITGFPPYDGQWVRYEPPLPTEPCVIRAKVKGPVPYRVLFGHPNPGEEGGMTFCRDIDGLTYKADEIESFEVLWREGERGKDALVPWEAIDKLRDAYPSDPGAYMTPVDFFLRAVVGDR